MTRHINLSQNIDSPSLGISTKVGDVHQISKYFKNHHFNIIINVPDKVKLDRVYVIIDHSLNFTSKASYVNF